MVTCPEQRQKIAALELFIAKNLCLHVKMLFHARPVGEKKSRVERVEEGEFMSSVITETWSCSRDVESKGISTSHFVNPAGSERF